MAYVDYGNRCGIEVLNGRKIISVAKNTDFGDVVIFTMEGGDKYQMYHSQDCCEQVYLEDVNGDWEDLQDATVIEASERTSDENPIGVKPEYQDCYQWTFYHIRTNKGVVVLRWYGDSNGYYSVDVTFGKLTEN